MSATNDRFGALVFCKYCRWFETGTFNGGVERCIPPNSPTINNYYEAKQEGFKPSIQNQSNNCKWFEAIGPKGPALRGKI